MGVGQALTSGVVGAVTVTALNEGVRQVYPHAPRMEVIGMRALAATLRGAEVEPPPRDTLYYVALAGDLAGNALYYSLVGDATTATWKRGIVLGLAAGIGAALLPRPLGLGAQPRQRVTTQLLTVAWYLAGGIAAVAAARRRS